MTTSTRDMVDAAIARFPAAEFVPAGAGPLTHAAGQGPIMTYRRSDGLVLSAISDRTFLAGVIDKLMPLCGRRVLEIGSGTGYLATVVGVLCGEAGKVVGCEIIRELFELSIANVTRAGVRNVTIVSGDFVDVVKAGDTFDVVLATSSMSEIHRVILDACRSGGLIALPIEVPGGGDCFTIFERSSDALVARDGMLSVSVPTTGHYSQKSIWAPPIDSLLPDWDDSKKIVIRNHSGHIHFINETLAFRSYLLFNEPLFCAVSLSEGHLAKIADMAFGLVCSETSSCYLLSESHLYLRGSRAFELASRFTAWQQKWEAEGRPSLPDYCYRIGLELGQGFDFGSGFAHSVAILRGPS